MNWTSPLNFYCERTGPDFWSEPLNAVSNIAFIIAAALALRLWLRLERRDWPVLALIGVTVAVGVGSFLFHTFANRWSLMADVLPIQMFILGYFLLAMRRFIGLPVVLSLMATGAFFMLARELPRIHPFVFLGGAGGYLGGLLALFGVAAALLFGWTRGVLDDGVRRATGWSVFVTGLIFMVSLTARQMDNPLCDVFPIGTHPLWHALNAVVLYRLLIAAIKAGNALRSPPSAHAG